MKLTAYVHIFPLLIALFSAAALADTIPTQWQTDVNSGASTLAAADLFVGGIVGYLQNDANAIWGLGGISTNASQTPDENTIFEIGSVTKSFTGIVLAEQIIEGTLTLDGIVEQYLPEFKGTFVGGITLRQLATHTSGLPRMPCDDPSTPYCFHPKDPANPYVDYTWSQLRDYLLHFAPAGYDPSQPRPSYPRNYSNTGFGLLGYLLMQTDVAPSFDSMIAHRITLPLAMPDTAVNLNSEQMARFVSGYDITQAVTPHWDWSVMVATGGIHSTAKDMMQYLRANLDPEKLLDAPRTKNLALAMILSHAEGLGWDSLPGAQVVWKNGETAGFASVLAFNKSKELGDFILVNEADAPDTNTLLNLPFPGVSLPDVQGISVTALDQFVGSYQCTYGTNNQFTITITHPNKFLTISGYTLATLRATSQTDFNLVDGFYPAGWNSISFSLNSGGSVTGATLHTKDNNGNPNPDYACVVNGKSR